MKILAAIVALLLPIAARAQTPVWSENWDSYVYGITVPILTSGGSGYTYSGTGSEDLIWSGAGCANNPTVSVDVFANAVQGIFGVDYAGNCATPPSGNVYWVPAPGSGITGGSGAGISASTVFGALSTVQLAAFTGSISGTVLTVSGASGAPLTVGEEVAGAGISVVGNGLYYIQSFGTGTGGNGTYNMSTSYSISAEAMTAQNWSQNVGGYGWSVASNAQSVSSPWSLSMAGNVNNTSGTNRVVPPQLNEGYLVFKAYLAPLTGTQASDYIQVATDSFGNNSPTVNFGQNGAPAGEIDAQLQNNATALGHAPVAGNVWNTYVLAFKMSAGSDGYIRLYYNGSLFLSYSGVTGTANPFGEIRLFYINNGVQTYYDDISIYNTPYAIGGVHVMQLN